jgi:hypothetical protein
LAIDRCGAPKENKDMETARNLQVEARLSSRLAQKKRGGHSRPPRDSSKLLLFSLIAFLLVMKLPCFFFEFACILPELLSIIKDLLLSWS